MARQADATEALACDGIGEQIYALAAEIYPICRSITGDGVRNTPGRLTKHLAIDVREVSTGTPAFDWTIPREWNIRDAYILDSDGNKIVDFAKSNLHVIGYSVPVRKRLPLSELRQHLVFPPATARNIIPIERPITLKIGASACRIASSRPCRTKSPKLLSIPVSKTAF